jgi:hypothetical protein
MRHRKNLLRLEIGAPATWNFSSLLGFRYRLIG